MDPKRGPLAPAFAALISILAAVCLPGCGTDPSAAAARFPLIVPGKIDLAATDAGIILITSDTNCAEIAADPPTGKVETMSEGAADATRTFLNTPSLGNPQLEAAVGVIQFALAPFAAGYGAIGASQKRLSPSELEGVQVALSQSMSANAAPDLLVQTVTEVARQKTRRTLLCTVAGSKPPADQAPVSAVLRIAVKQMCLKAVKPGGNQYRLSIQTSVVLVRTSDRHVLLAKSYRYDSGADLFIDWTRNKGLEDAARTGYRILAEQITDDVFQPVSQPPILIGPGQKQPNQTSVRIFHSRELARTGRAEWTYTPVARERQAFNRNRPVLLKARRRVRPHLHGHTQDLLARQASERAPTRTAATSPSADPPQEQAGAMEIHTGKADERLRIPAQTAKSGSDLGVVSDTKWSLDGLEDDRNAVVQGVACLAAVPFGLWEQTVGAVQNHSREKKEELARALGAAITREGFEGELADGVARHLESSVADPIRRTDEPIRFALADRETGESGTKTNVSAQCKTALEIQVVSMRFAGEHPNSASRAIVVEVQATVYRASDGQELYSRPVRYQSVAKRLKDWAASDARLFRRELNDCSRQTAQALLDDLVARGFLTPLPGGDPGVSPHK
jgi:hypothetical protein